MLLPIILLLLFSPFVLYESIRGYTTYQTCSKIHAQNQLLLDNPLCSDPWQRHLHGEKQNALCNQAQQENLISPASCAMKRMWTEGEVYRVWTMFTHSYWMLTAALALGLGASLGLVMILLWSCDRRAQRKSQEQLYRETLLAVGGGNARAQPAHYLPSPSERYGFYKQRQASVVELIDQ